LEAKLTTIEYESNMCLWNRVDFHSALWSNRKVYKLCLWIHCIM